jgi:integrase
MLVESLDRDNPLLSRPTKDDEGVSEGGMMVVREIASAQLAANCKASESEAVRAYVEAGIAEATRRAYKSDLEHFRTWGGDIPTTDVQLATYLADYATSLKPATLTRRLAAISVAHAAQRLPNPVSSPLIRAAMRGIRRERGTAQSQAAPLLRDDLFSVLEATGDGIKDLRDRALLLLGFASALRRSELVALDCGDIERVRQGLIVRVRKSKTDQDAVGRKIGVPLGRSKWCPVLALERWLEAVKIVDGAIFRRVDRHGHVSTERLSAEGVCLVLRQRVARAGYDPERFSGHSLRAGLATSAAQAGVSPWRIRQTTGHASDAMLARYVRDGELFTGNAAGALL